MINLLHLWEALLSREVHPDVDKRAVLQEVGSEFGFVPLSPHFSPDLTYLIFCLEPWWGVGVGCGVLQLLWGGGPPFSPPCPPARGTQRSRTVFFWNWRQNLCFHPAGRKTGELELSVYDGPGLPNPDLQYEVVFQLPLAGGHQSCQLSSRMSSPKHCLRAL